ncbi:MAG: thiolase family protein [Candidatus Marinimicrobia bacterium]|jgi:acetyl-CoA C-acetyltransferase|nr:thiolase family protein [Candidatus Neomarinimicrobiota bacterium]MDP6338815.1 thiolase family protein [Candidatus Neomarinimicrobiota bacterium]MDP6612196.1 thiolase family protein [Candidatus Neomarinimicrobiota bacterium]MDP7330406.1 thiolase family protein [Candidatus Neomarinimicrobiota bacterium]MDP7436205.1 thiolase family protein [Candidatus Neomarinimicrobiota bacterium]|tara:strand:+ start:1121 stop:2362 length:1242 start_codon:yes stop_codon:yes gene_type:complete
MRIAFACTYNDVFLINGARTPFGKFMGSLGAVTSTNLGIIASKNAIEKSEVKPADIDHVIYANIIQSSFDAIYIPRHIGLYCGIPSTVPALLVQRICGSGFESIISGAEQIVLEKASIVLAGGAENMTLTPTSSFGNRMGYRLGGLKFGDMLFEGLYDPAGKCSMGQTAENLAKKYNISREDVDVFALRSHSLAVKKMTSGVFAKEITPVSSGVIETEGLAPRKIRTIPSKCALDFDENIRETSLEQLQGLNPTFAKDGVQTAGNSSAIVDGAASVIVASGDAVKSKGLKPLAKIVASASAGVEPNIMGIGPAPAIRDVLDKTGLSIDNIDLFEINEAFGAQIVAVERELELDREKLNVNGGAIAIGHPLAATGTRLTHTLALELKRQNGKYGIASACIGGGQGTAILIENCD